MTNQFLTSFLSEKEKIVLIYLKNNIQIKMHVLSWIIFICLVSGFSAEEDLPKPDDSGVGSEPTITTDGPTSVNNNSTGMKLPTGTENPKIEQDNSTSGWMIFLYIMLGLSAVAVLGIVGFILYKKKFQ